MKGHSIERGKIFCEKLEIQLGAESVDIIDNVMIIKINNLFRHGMDEAEICEATNKWWVAKQENAEKVEYVLSVCNGIVRGVFKPTRWYKAEDSNRIAFEGEPAPSHIVMRYFHRSIEHCFAKGNANPIQYFFVSEVNSEEEFEESMSIDKQ